MAENSTEKNNSNGEVSSSSISNVLKMVNTAFSIGSPPATTLPPPLILTGGNLRSGLSARDIAARIISKRSQAGLPSGNIFPDGPNTDEIMERIRIEEIINAILTEAVVQVSILPNIPIIGIGTGNSGLPVLVQGATTSIGSGKGIIS